MTSSSPVFSEPIGLRPLLGSSLRILLKDNRTIQGTLELLDSSSLLLSNTLETKPPPQTPEEEEIYINRDRYYPRSNSYDGGGVQAIDGLGVAREIGAVLVNFKDVVRVQVGKGDWELVTGLGAMIQ